MIQDKLVELKATLADMTVQLETWFGLAWEYRIKLDGIRNILAINKEIRELDDPILHNFKQSMLLSATQSDGKTHE